MSIESLIFEKGAPGRRAATMAAMDVPTEPIENLLSRQHAAQGGRTAARGERDRGCAPLYAPFAAQLWR